MRQYKVNLSVISGYASQKTCRTSERYGLNRDACIDSSIRRVFCGALRLPVGSATGHRDYMLLGGFCGNVDPALVLVAGDLNGDRPGGSVAGYAGEARCDQVVDVAGDNEQDGHWCRFERRLEAGGIEQAEGNVQGFAEASIGVVVDVPGMHDDADPEPAVLPARIREAGVVAAHKPAENGDDKVEQQGLVGWVDQGEQAIAAVSEPVAAARADSRRARWRGVLRDTTAALVTSTSTCPG
jgi:hypothetical protein